MCLMKSISYLTLLLMISSCTGNAPPSLCDRFHAIYVQDSDRLTIETKREILTHDMTGQTLCGWKEAQ